MQICAYCWSHRLEHEKQENGWHFHHAKACSIRAESGRTKQGNCHSFSCTSSPISLRFEAPPPWCWHWSRKKLSTLWKLLGLFLEQDASNFQAQSLCLRVGICGYTNAKNKTTPDNIHVFKIGAFLCSSGWPSAPSLHWGPDKFSLGVQSLSSWICVWGIMNVCTCIHRCMSPHKCVGAFTCGVQRMISGLPWQLSTLFIETGLNSDLTDLTSLASQLVPSTKCWDYRL